MPSFTTFFTVHLVQEFSVLTFLCLMSPKRLVFFSRFQEETSALRNWSLSFLTAHYWGQLTSPFFDRFPAGQQTKSVKKYCSLLAHFVFSKFVVPAILRFIFQLNFMNSLYFVILKRSWYILHIKICLQFLKPKPIS